MLQIELKPQASETITRPDMVTAGKDRPDARLYGLQLIIRNLFLIVSQ
jgi:hypothetical protein